MAIAMAMGGWGWGKGMYFFIVGIQACVNEIGTAHDHTHLMTPKTRHESDHRDGAAVLDMLDGDC